MVLPAAPYSNIDKNQDIKNDRLLRSSNYLSQENQAGCSKSCFGVLRRLFSFKMIKTFLIVLPSASLTAIFEAVIFSFLSFNASDKTNDSPLALPFLVVIAYYGSIFFMSLG